MIYPGMKIGKLSVLRQSGSHLRSRLWLCICECGAEVERTSKSLQQSGPKTSCGCLRGITYHGGHGSPEYTVWRCMRERCNKPGSANYWRYGARGIIVCERWASSFPTFLADMGPRPSMRHSLDRIDNDGPYSPENCRWATRTEQANNHRANRRVIFAGTAVTVAQAAAATGLAHSTILSRIVRGDEGDDLFRLPKHGMATLARKAR